MPLKRKICLKKCALMQICIFLSLLITDQHYLSMFLDDGTNIPIPHARFRGFDSQIKTLETGRHKTNTLFIRSSNKVGLVQIAMVT